MPGLNVVDFLKGLRKAGRKVSVRTLAKWGPLVLSGNQVIQDTVKGYAQALEKRAIARARSGRVKGANRSVEYALYGADIVRDAATKGIFALLNKTLEVEDTLTDFVLGDELEAITDVPEEAIRDSIAGLGRMIDSFNKVVLESRKARLGLRREE